MDLIKAWPPQRNYADVPPDRICEVLSHGTIRIDRVRKMPVYARFNVGHAWRVDPAARTLEVFRL
jgi:Uma2 family endonuclease